MAWATCGPHRTPLWLARVGRADHLGWVELGAPLSDWLAVPAAGTPIERCDGLYLLRSELLDASGGRWVGCFREHPSDRREAVLVRVYVWSAPGRVRAFEDIELRPVSRAEAPGSATAVSLTVDDRPAPAR